MLWGEARGIPSDTEKAACIWCVLNRVDNGMGSIVEVVTAPYQFVGYQEDHPVDPELKALCEDVLARWYQEKDGKTDVGRVLPSNYLFFTGGILLSAALLFGGLAITVVTISTEEDYDE